MRRLKTSNLLCLLLTHISTKFQSWNKREQIFKTQTDEYTRTLELKEVEIDELKKQLAQINDEHSSSAKVKNSHSFE